MKKLIKAIIAIVVAIIVADQGIMAVSRHIEASDDFVADRVVMLKSAEGSCSGVQVIAPSSKVYILTAAHCEPLVHFGKVLAVAEDGTQRYVSVVAIDKESDLMLLSAITQDGVKVADSVEMHDKVHSITHGAGFPRYRTDGEILHEISSLVPIAMVGSQAEADACYALGHTDIVESIFGYLCVKSMISTATTAKVVPGSSGGAVVDADGHLVGIVSLGDGDFGYLVRLSDIHAFLASR